MSRFLSVFKLAELASHRDPSLLSIVDSADVSLFFLSKLDESRRWICTFQEAALFIYTTTSRCRYRFAIFNKNITSTLSIDRFINNDIIREDITTKLKISAENIQQNAFFSYESEKDLKNRGLAFATKTDCLRIYSLILRLKYIVSPGPIFPVENRHENKTSREDHENRTAREIHDKPDRAYVENTHRLLKDNTNRQKSVYPVSYSSKLRRASPPRKQKEARSGAFPLHKLVNKNSGSSRANSNEERFSESERSETSEIQKNDNEKSEPKIDEKARLQFENLLQKLNTGVDKRRKQSAGSKAQALPEISTKDSGIEVNSSSPTSSSRSSLSSKNERFDRNPSSRSQISPENLFSSMENAPPIDIESLPVPSPVPQDKRRSCPSCCSKTGNKSPCATDLLLRGPLEHDVIPEVDEETVTSSDDGSEIFKSIFSQSELKFTTDTFTRNKLIYEKVFSSEESCKYHSDNDSDDSDAKESKTIYQYAGSRSLTDLSSRKTQEESPEGIVFDDSAHKELVVPSYNEFLSILGDSLKTQEFYRKFRNEFLIDSLKAGRKLYL